MLFFLLRRLLATLPVLAIVALIVFLMLRLAPGDPAAAILGDNASEAAAHSVRASMGLTDSIPVQFVKWSDRLLRGDLGESFFLKQKVSALVAQRLEPTIALAGMTLLLTILVAVPIGVLAAWRHGSLLDRVLMSFSVMGFSIPAFVIGYVLIWVFSVEAGWFPAQGYARMEQGFVPWIQHLVLPSITLSIIYVALIARVTRAAVAEALTEDYVRTARAKGVSELTVLLRHALPNAAIPVVTVIGIGIALLIGGVVVTETVFAIPGLGQLTVDAVLSRDYPVIQAITLFFAFAYVLINLLVDLSYLFLDPRIRY